MREGAEKVCLALFFALHLALAGEEPGMGVRVGSRHTALVPSPLRCSWMHRGLCHQKSVRLPVGLLLEAS